MEVFYGLTYIPPKKDKVLTPSTSECKLTWKKVLYIGKDKVKMRGHTVGPTPRSTSKGNLETERHTGPRQPCDWSQGIPWRAGKHQKPEEALKDSPLDPLERVWP